MIPAEPKELKNEVAKRIIDLGPISDGDDHLLQTVMKWVTVN
jgi:hypothetical protein